MHLTPFFYFLVVEATRQDMEGLIVKYYEANPDSSPSTRGPPYSQKEKAIAAAYQRFLILSILANVRDRQRTIRELEVGRTFIRIESTSQSGEDESCWAIKHGPEDYKTGKSYGERPPIHLSVGLTPYIDDFLSNWRTCLRPTTAYFFVQQRGGKPMTGNSVYKRVCQSCYKYTGKRTTPHLLRDMLVTHVRERGDASEQQLEALALLMGHSLDMQRTSYDRRTLTKKIAPAMQLMQSVNQGQQP